ncbi:MAG: tetratricopeptide repeat protein [Desulfobulbaceae bacterium]|nr:tetratricopeptide repeat protein [Desulfobulbaceae bacterium]
MTGEELFEKGQDLFLKKKYTDSSEAFKKALDEGYDAVTTHLSIGAAYLHDRKFDEAMREFSKVIELDKENDRALYYRGIAYMNKKDFPCAVADFNNSIEKNKDRATAFLARGIAQAESGNEQDAVENFKRAVAFAQAEVKNFSNLFGSTMTSFDRSMALLEGERGPLTKVLTKEEIEKVKNWME